jgi:hypothetical protein
MAVFGLAILAMAWAGFRRWLHHRESLSRKIADQEAQGLAQHGALMERVEARLNRIEQLVSHGGAHTTAPIEHQSATRPRPPSGAD